MTNFGGVVLWCHELEEMLRFYRVLGLEFTAEQHENGPKHWAAQTGTTVLELYTATSISVPRKRLAVGIVILTDDVLRVAQFFRAGYPETPFPNDHLQGFHIEDPQGNRVYVVRRHMIPVSERLRGIAAELQAVAEDMRAHPEIVPDFETGMLVNAMLATVASARIDASGALNLTHDYLIRAKQLAEGWVPWAEYCVETHELRCGKTAPGARRESGCMPLFPKDETEARSIAFARYGVVDSNFHLVPKYNSAQDVKATVAPGAEVPGGYRLGQWCYFNHPDDPRGPTGLGPRRIGQLHAYDSARNVITILHEGAYIEQEHVFSNFGSISAVAPADLEMYLKKRAEQEQALVHAEHDQTP